MKLLNFDKEYENYKELFEDNPEMYTDDTGWDKAVMLFGKYKGMLIKDVREYDPRYFQYMKGVMLNEHVSSSLLTYNSYIKTLKAMFSVERYYQIERWEKEYERRKKSATYCY